MQRLREYIVKGFTMDDERLKQRGGGNYFEELQGRIRDVRSAGARRSNRDGKGREFRSRNASFSRDNFGHFRRFLRRVP